MTRSSQEHGASGKVEPVQYRALKDAIQEGLESGESEKTVTEIMEDAEARLKTDNRL